MDFSNYKFRCHYLGELFTDPRDAELREKGEWSTTAKARLYDIFLQEYYHRDYNTDSNQTIKGTEVESIAIDMYAEKIGRYVVKNTVRMEDDYITGECDIQFNVLQNGKAIKKVVDVKSSYELQSFTKNRHEKVNKAYLWQAQGYMRLFEAGLYDLAHCLINTPKWIIDRELNSVDYNFPAATREGEKARILKNHIFDDIPFNQRIIIRNVPRNESLIESIPERVKRARDFLNELLIETEKGNLFTELN